MDAQIIINSIDQTAYLTSITRSYNYCSVSQEFTIEIDLSCPTTIDPYNTVVIYEEGIKVLTGFVSSATKKAPEAKLVVKGQDTFTKASDFFVPTTYTTNFGQTAQYWITFLLDLAGLTAIFTDGAGPYIIAEQEIGLSSVADLITPILQYAGWYARVNTEGIVVVGKIDKIPLSPPILEGIAIIDDGLSQSYDKTRNKAIIFGGIDTQLNRFEQIIAIAERELAFLPVDQTVVIGNPLIADQDSADDFANALVNEFARPTQIKNLTILANPVYQAGKYVEVHSDLFTGIALITSMNSKFDDSGYTMSLILDDPCPRVVGAIKHQPELYAGTLGNGVWAYNMYSGAWENISAGLTNLYINDLSVDNGLFIVATPAGIYTKLASDPWIHQTLPLYSGSDGTLIYSGVYANLFDLEVNAIVTSTRPDYNYAWLYTGTIASGGSGFRWSGNPIRYSGGHTYSGEYYSATDLEGNYGYKTISTHWQTDNTTDVTYYVVEGKSIYSMGLHGEGQQSVLQSHGSEIYEQPAISHDGTRLVFASNVEAGLVNDIFVSNLDGTNPRKLATSGFGAYHPDWSLDDTRIVFIKESPFDSEIYIMNADGTSQTQITSGTDSFYRKPRFISDHQIAYSKVTGIDFYNLYVIDDTGLNETQITFNSFDTEMSTYNSPQLRALYVANGGTPSVNAYSINTDGTNPTLVYDDAADVSAPNLTDDGKFLVYSSGGKIYIVGLVNKVERRLTSNNHVEDFYTLIANPDYNGQDVAYYLDDSVAARIRRINISDGSNHVDFWQSSNPSWFVTSMVSHPQKHYFAWVETNAVLSAGNVENIYISDGTTVTNIVHSLDFFNWAIWPDRPAPYAVHPLEAKVAIWTPKQASTLENFQFDLYEIGSNAAGRLTNNEHYFPVDRPSTPFYNWQGTKIAYGYPGDPNQIWVDGIYTLDGILIGWTQEENTIIYMHDNVAHDLPKDIYSYNLITSEEVLICPADTTHFSLSVELSPNNKFHATTTNHGLGLAAPLFVGTIGHSEQLRPDGGYATWTSDSESLVYRKESTDDLYIISMKVTLASGTQPFHRVIKVSPRTRVFETFDNQTFNLVFDDRYSYLENNIDTFSPLTVYGKDGNYYSEDLFLSSGTIASGLITYDVAARWEDNEVSMYATTTSGIYRTIVSGIPNLVNTVAAREIVTRYYGSGEIFFSVGGQVKKSLNECATYVDISSGLPGSQITVLRLDK